MTMLNWQGWAANFQGWGSVGAVVQPPAIPDFHTGPAGGIHGRGAKRRLHKFALEIDGKLYPVASQQEAIAILRKARAEVKREVRHEIAEVKATPALTYQPPEAPQVQVLGESPLRAYVEQQVQHFQRDMDAMLAQADQRAREIEAEQDDEDVLLLL